MAVTVDLFEVVALEVAVEDISSTRLAAMDTVMLEVCLFVL